MGEIQQMAEDLDRECLAVKTRSPLPIQPDSSTVEKWLIATHRAWILGDPWLLQPLSRR